MDLFCRLNLPLLDSNRLGTLQLIPSFEEGWHFFAFHPRLQRDRHARQKNILYIMLIPGPDLVLKI